MKHNWLISENREKLVIFFNGWGMDYTLFKEYKSDKYDVLMFYSYSNINNKYDFDLLFSKYKEVILVAWSMGVWVSSVVCSDFKNKLKYKIALNSTLKPVDNNYGIVTKVYQATIDNFSAIGRAKFFKRMWNNIEIPERFKKHKAIREIPEQKEELIYLKSMFEKFPEPENIFDIVIIGTKDLICPTKNQIRYCEEKNMKYKTIDAPHFLFYHWEKWEELVEYAIKN